MTKLSVLILGARSDIARATASLFAQRGYSLQLAARNVETLQVIQTDMELRYPTTVTLHEFDALAIDHHEKFIDDLPNLPDVVVCAVGAMDTQSLCETDPVTAIRVIRSNFEGPAIIMGLLANSFAERGSGTLVGISSVAGERGRGKNYIYGSAKAGFTAFLSGLRNRCAKMDVHVITVLPGFVATQMTEDMELPSKLTAQPIEVAEAIVKAVQRKTNLIYVRPVWKFIMLIICYIPEQIFKRMDI
ncbi:SDR family oxidoreductase [Planktomarina temperata]|nr:SDR family oxidoreductase [Planktomarina temperata]